MPVSLEPATTRLGALVGSVSDDALDTPTPCDIPVGALLDHIASLSAAFTAAARKDGSAASGPPPPPDVANLAQDWRDSIPHALDELAQRVERRRGVDRVDANRWPRHARRGRGRGRARRSGPPRLGPRRAIGQPFDLDRETLEALVAFLTHMAEPGMVAAREGLFGPVVSVRDDAPLIDHIVGFAGRDPAWSPR